MSSYGDANNYRGIYATHCSSAMLNEAQVINDSRRYTIELLGIVHCWKIEGKWKSEYETMDEVRTRLAREVQE